MNDHVEAKSVAEVIELKHFLGEPLRDDLNPNMLKNIRS